MSYFSSNHGAPAQEISSHDRARRRAGYVYQCATVAAALLLLISATI